MAAEEFRRRKGWFLPQGAYMLPSLRAARELKQRIAGAPGWERKYPVEKSKIRTNAMEEES